MKYRTPLLLLGSLCSLSLTQAEEACEADTAAAATSNTETATAEAEAEAADRVLERDICIIGGGSSGIYSAIRLQELNQSVVVIETSDRLGGHCETYTDPVTGGTIDTGVVVFHNTSLVRDYFGRFNISLVGAQIDTASSVVTLPIDFQLGVAAPASNTSTTESLAAGLAAYGAQLAQYPYLEFGFDLPSPVPEDLLIPFRDFIVKHNLTDPTFVQFWWHFAQGLGDALDLPSVYVLKNFHMYILQALGSQGGAAFIANGLGGCQQLYTAATAKLGEDVLLSSQVVSMDRDADESYASVIVQTADGSNVEARCGKILVTAPPLPESLTGFDLSSNETDLFSQFQAYSYHTAVVRNSGIPANISASNIAFDQEYNIPALPTTYNLAQSGLPNLVNAKYISNTSVTEEFAKQDMLAATRRLQIPGKDATAEPEIVFYANHNIFELHVDADAIRDGFYGKLYDLQGERKTFYTGATWHTHDSSYVWEFTESLLPRIIE